MDRAFWKGKKVLVTGHTGFKGSWLSLWLQNLEAEVLGYALSPPSKPNLFEIAEIADGMTCITGDIHDLEHLKAVLAQHKPEIVIHMAAQALIRRSYTDPVQTYTTNVLGTVNVLEAVRKSRNVRAVVCITSDKCYENKEWLWGYRENERMGGRDPYSSSKACAELVISAYRDSYFSAETYKRHGVAVASSRAGNVIGGGDWARDRLIPDTMKAVLENRPIFIRNPNATRPWQYVLEPLSGYLSLAERLCTHGAEFAQSWNFGPRQEANKSVSWIAEYITTQWGNGSHWKLDPAPHAHENHYLKLDSSKASSLLGWSTKLSLATTLDWIVEWYRGYQQKENVRHLTRAQIARYENYQKV